jgi:hypothetical protein
MSIPKAFLDRALDPSPALRVKFSPGSSERPRKIRVEHQLGQPPGREGREYLNSLRTHAALAEFRQFYKKHDGLQLCRTLDSRYDEVRPLLEFKPAESIDQFTRRYRPRGDRAWTMDLNKSKRLYRATPSWLAFAEIDSGPMCLTIFLDGDHAGHVFYVTPQPQFNILRPVASGFFALLDRVANDIAAFLRLVRAYVTIRSADGYNEGFVPVQYLPTGKVGSKPSGRTGR